MLLVSEDLAIVCGGGALVEKLLKRRDSEHRVTALLAPQEVALVKGLFEQAFLTGMVQQATCLLRHSVLKQTEIDITMIPLKSLGTRMCTIVLGPCPSFPKQELQGQPPLSQGGQSLEPRTDFVSPVALDNVFSTVVPGQHQARQECEAPSPTRARTWPNLQQLTEPVVRPGPLTVPGTVEPQEPQVSSCPSSGNSMIFDISSSSEEMSEALEQLRSVEFEEGHLRPQQMASMRALKLYVPMGTQTEPCEDRLNSKNSARPPLLPGTREMALLAQRPLQNPAERQLRRSSPMDGYWTLISLHRRPKYPGLNRLKILAKSVQDYKGNHYQLEMDGDKVMLLDSSLELEGQYLLHRLRGDQHFIYVRGDAGVDWNEEGKRCRSHSPVAVSQAVRGSRS